MEEAKNQTQQEEQKQQETGPKISKRQQKKLKLDQTQENLTREEIEAQRQKIFESLKNPCEGCKVKEGTYSLRQVKSLCESCFQRKIYNRIYLHIRGKVPLGGKLLVAIVGNHFPENLDNNNNPLARDYLVFETMFGKSKNGTKQLHEIQILYIDLGCQKSKSTVQKWAQQTGVQLNIVTLQQEFFDNDIQKMSDFFKLFKDYDEVQKVLQFNLIMNQSVKLGFDQVFLSDSGQDIAKNTFGLFAQGRGLSVIQEINAVTKTQYRGKQLQVFRMLKDIVESEVQGYYGMVQEQVKLQQQQQQQEQQQEEQKEQEEELSQEQKDLLKIFGNAAVRKPTIEKILGNFFGKLQETFPSTVHTALRSFDKVEDKFKESQDPCFICLGKMDKIVNQLELDSYEDLGKSQVQNIQGICFGCMRMIKNSNSDIETIMKSLPQMIKDNNQNKLIIKQ